MEIELSQRAIDAIAMKVAVIVEKRLREKEVFPDLVTTEEAARILHISKVRMRQIADQYPHIKAGDSRNSRLLFERKYLLQ